jgi:hypothetical protein
MAIYEATTMQREDHVLQPFYLKGIFHLSLIVSIFQAQVAYFCWWIVD